MAALSSDLRGVQRWLVIFALATLFGVLAYLGVTLTRDHMRIAAVWLPNALLIAFMLRQQRVDLSLVAAAFMANFVADIAAGDPLLRALCLSLVNSIEVILVCAMMRRLGCARPDMAQFRDLAVFCLVGGVLAPAVAGAIAAMILSMKSGFDIEMWLSWTLTDGLGMLLLAPSLWIAADAWRHRAWPSRQRLVEWVLIVLGGTALVVGVFAQSRYSLFHVVTPFVLLAAFRLGRLGAAAATLIVAVVALIATWAGTGPISLVSGDMADQLHVLQGFLVINFCMSLPVAAALAGRAAIARALQENEALNRSILDNMREIIFKTDADGRWVFLNPAWEPLTGYSVAESLGWHATRLLHRDDLAASTDMYLGLASGAIDDVKQRQRFYRKCGELAHIDVSIRRLTDDQGRFQGVIGSIRDITETVRQERALADGESRFRRMAEAAPVGIFRADANGKVTYVNKAWCTTVGLSFEESLGDGWMTPAVELEDCDSAPLWTGYKAPGDVRRRLVRFRTADDRELWCETVNSAEFDEDGAIVGFVGAVIDITEQRRATERLANSERRFQTLANLAPAGIFRTDAKGLCTYVNAAWLGLTGLTDGEWQDHGWARALHPEDRARALGGWAAAVSERRDYRSEFRWLRPDGSCAWVDVLGRPEHGPDGEIIGYIGVTMDITERRLVEQALKERDAQLSLLAENATDAVFRLTLDGRCLYASPSTKELIGIDPRQLVGKYLLKRFHPDDAARVDQTFEALANGQTERSIIAFRSEIIDRPGSYRWLEANCGVVADPQSGSRLEIIASIRDISHAKEMEEALRRARARAEQAAEAKSIFLANMSHEIRTPMNGVIGFTDLLANTPLGEDQRRYVELIADSGRSMMRLLNDILDVSKIEAGHMPLAQERVDVRSKIGGVIRLMEPSATAKGIRLTQSIDADVPDAILADPLRLRQILLNLVGNAVKFTQQGQVELIATKAEEPAGPVLRIDVRDTGIGIAADRIEAAFESFGQADASIARRFGGTGLGLSITRQLVGLMGGRISVVSKLGRGSVFTVLLPIRPPVIDATSPASTAGSPLIDAVQPGVPSARILVAEDHDINQALMIGLGQHLGLRIDIASDGEQVAAMVRDADRAGWMYDLVLMDMQMPVIDGLEATRRLRAGGFSAERLPIIALTANAYDEDISACLEAGMQAHLGKPVTAADLTAIIERHVHAPAADRAPTQEMQQARLEALYRKRRHETLDAIARLVDTAGHTDDAFEHAVDLLHKLAGTSGMFGEPALGDAASTLEHTLRAADPADRADAILKGLRQLQQAAA